MRKIMRMFFTVLAAAFVAVSLAIDCPPTAVTPAPPDVNAAAIHYKLLCVKQGVEGKIITTQLSACDPDGDRMNYRLMQAPAGMEIRYATIPIDQEAELFWVAEFGTWYVDVEVFDCPPDPNDSLTDRGSLVFIVRKANQAPVFGGCR